jgi:hypothetical protein
LGVDGVRAIALGHASAGPLLVTNGDGGRLFDPDSLAELAVPPDDDPAVFDRPPDNRPRVLPMPDYAVAASANGRVFAGSRVVSVRGGRVVVTGHGGPAYTFGAPRPSPDGRYVFNQSGPVSSDGHPAPDVTRWTRRAWGAFPRPTARTSSGWSRRHWSFTGTV